MATDIIARGMITEYKSGTNINFAENEDGSVTISASGSISSEDSVARDAINNHKSDTSNPHNVTPAQIGLGNVDNTSDLDKPISTAVQKAIDSKADKTVVTTSADGLMSAEDKGKLDDADNTYALKSKYGDTTINVGRKVGTTVGINSTAEGFNTTASGAGSHAEGFNTTASGECSHAGGLYTKALHDYEAAFGNYNESNDNTLFSVGDGTADDARHNAFEITTTGGKLHDKDIATTDLIPTKLPANGGTADTARQVTSPSSKVRLYEDNEGGNLRLVSPDGVHYMEMDLYNNEQFRMYFDGGDGIVSGINYDFTTKKLNINGDAGTVSGHTVNADVPADAVFTDTIPDLTPYALKSKYGDTTIDVGRKAGTTVGGYSVAEGQMTTASGLDSHAEGGYTIASADGAHAEGWLSTASGHNAHAEGYNTTASGDISHAEGYITTASGYASHAGGMHTKALHDNEVAYGRYNKSNDDTLFSVGDGGSDTARHNAFEITTSGGMLHDKDILTSAHCIQFIPYNLKYYAQNGRILLFSNDDAVARGIYFVNNTPNDITVCALISASAAGPAVQYGYGTNTYPEIQNTGEGREWFSEKSIPTSPTIFAMTVPSGKLGYYGVYHNSESTYTTIHDIRCPYFNYF